MKKLMLFCAFMTALSHTISAQISNYGFTAYNNTYTPITGNIITLDFVDNGRTALLPIGFNFVYDGVTYTDLSASTNGMAKLGATIVSNTDVSFFRTLQNNGERPILAPLWDDMMMSSLNGMAYQTSGTSPNQVFTLQWSQVKWPYANSVASIEFQLKLYEGSNKIEFTYNQLAGTIFGAGALIGISALATGPGNYLSVQSVGTSPVVSATSQSIISTKPAQGQVYSFQPLSQCSTPLSVGTTTSSATTVCNNTNFTLSVSGASQALGLSYQWQSSTDNNSWQDITGANGASLSTVQTSSTYYRRSISCGASTGYSASLMVSQMTTPSVTAAGVTSFCQGGSVTLTSSAGSGNQWYKDGNAISGAVNSTYVANASGDYTVIATAGSCSSPASGAVTVLAKPVPSQPVITAAGTTTFCQGGSVTLNSSATSGNQWYLNGTAISGASATSYNATQSGNYNLIVTNNSCSSPISTTTIVTANPIPAAPVIGLNLNAFSSSATTGNEWYKDGVLIPGATGQFYLAFAFGSYSARVTTSGCTSAMSNAISYVPASLNSPSLENKLVIKNPVKNDLLITYKGGNARFTMELSDLSGKVIASSVFSSNFHLDVAGLARGMYLVRVVNQLNGAHLQQLIVKE